MANVLLIYPIKWEGVPAKTVHGDIYEGISIISAVLKKHSHKVKLFVLGCKDLENNWPLLLSTIKDFAPDVIGFSAFAPTYTFAQKASLVIRNKYPDIFQIIGGPHASLAPGTIIKDGFDAVCIGEGCFPMLALTKQIDKGIFPSNINNLWIKNKNNIEKNNTRAFIEDLDSLPFADRNLWDEWCNYDRPSHLVVTLGRGCPHGCTYCSNHALKRLSSGKYTRLRKPDHIIEEIKQFIEKYPDTKNVYLEVETITVIKDYAIDLCAKLKKLNSTLSSPLSFGCNVRVTPNTDWGTLFKSFKDANITWIAVGLESGSEKIRLEVLNRRYSNNDIITAVNTARNFGIGTYFYNLIGLPGETYKDFLETAKMNAICKPIGRQNSIFYPYEGTKLYELCKKQGLLNQKLDPLNERLTAQLDLPEFPKKKVQYCFDYFDYLVSKYEKNYRRAFSEYLKSTIKRQTFLYKNAKKIKKLIKSGHP